MSAIGQTIGDTESSASAMLRAKSRLAWRSVEPKTVSAVRRAIKPRLITLGRQPLVDYLTNLFDYPLDI